MAAPSRALDCADYFFRHSSIPFLVADAGVLCRGTDSFLLVAAVQAIISGPDHLHACHDTVGVAGPAPAPSAAAFRLHLLLERNTDGPDLHDKLSGKRADVPRSFVEPGL